MLKTRISVDIYQPRLVDTTSSPLLQGIMKPRERRQPRDCSRCRRRGCLVPSDPARNLGEILNDEGFRVVAVLGRMVGDEIVSTENEWN